MTTIIRLQLSRYDLEVEVIISEGLECRTIRVEEASHAKLRISKPRGQKNTEIKECRSLVRIERPAMEHQLFTLIVIRDKIG